MDRPRTLGLRQWIWRAFVRSALIPLVLVEVALIAIYLLTNGAIRDAQIRHLRESALADLQVSVQMEARIIDQHLRQVAATTELYRNLTREALEETGGVSALLALDSRGVRYSPMDTGGAASFYSAATEVARQDLEKVGKLRRLDSLMRELQASDPLIASLYFNSWDSYNHIYPWFDTAGQYPPDMVIPNYNFYYLADERHNPKRGVVWTDVYLDPAGHGWMMSAIAPVYRGDFLEGVSGIDITVSGLLEQIATLRLPWNGYAMLVSHDLNIMALPEAGERDFGLDELTDHSYDEAIRREVFKPEDFRLGSRPQTRELAQAISAEAEAVQRLSLEGQEKLIAWTRIEQTGWHLLAVVDEAQVFSQTNALASRYQHIGYLLIAGLVVFYLLFFAYMWLRARSLSQALLAPIASTSRMMGQIGLGNWRPVRASSDIRELDDLALHTQAIGNQLEFSEQQRSKAQRHLELVLESATEGLWEMDLDKCQVQFRGRLPARFGLPSSRMSEEQFLQRIHPDDQSRVRDELERMRQDSALRYECEYRFADALGQYAWLLSRGRVLERNLQTGQASLAAGTCVDIDAIKRVEEDLRLATRQAQDANEAKTHLISSISHELRTPLNAILGFAQLMRMDCAAEAEAAEYLDEILTASRHLNQLLADILDWSSLQAERPQLELEVVDANCLLRECAELVALDVRREGLQLEIELSAQPTQVLAETRRLRQVLLNLLSNAIKYNRSGGSIRLRVEPQREQVRLVVEDSGLGIDPAMQPRLFEPFQRLGRENSSIPGAGIGLSLCLEYVNLMGGEIGVSSEPGVGSCFWILLPDAGASVRPLTTQI